MKKKKMYVTSRILPAVVLTAGITSLLPFAARAENRVIALSATERVAIFDEAGAHTFVAPANLVGTAACLVVGGGGAGGGVTGGGGGGGQVIEVAGVTLEPGNEYPLTVAAGGVGVGEGTGANGGSSSFLAYTALGGGGGGGGWAAMSGLAGANGGGAGGNSDQAALGGQATVEGGFPGADRMGNYWGAGGGGGAAEAGHTTDESEYPGCGGAGIVSSLSGSEVMYGYGGGASGGRKSGAQNEWGQGAPNGGSPTAGEVGTGGGGGGGAWGAHMSGGAGGSGTVIIRYTVNMLHVTVDFSVENKQGLAPLTATFTADVIRPEEAEMTLAWNFGDGSEVFETTDLVVSHVYTQPGSYQVSVTVHAADQSASKSMADCIVVGNREIYVDPNSENPMAPYLTQETAAMTIEDALAVALTPGQQICLAPGVYPIERPIELSSDLSVVGMGASPEDVVVSNTVANAWFDSQADRVRNLFNLNHTAAKVANLTMAKGWNRMVQQNTVISAGGVTVGPNGGMVSNCVIRACVNSRCNFGAAGADLQSGLITHTRIEACYIDSPTAYSSPRGGASAIRLMGNARAENCLVRKCDNDAALTLGYSIVMVDSAQAAAINLTIVDSTVSEHPYNGNDDTKLSPCYGLYVNAGRAVNCVVANIRNIAYGELAAGAENRAWYGDAAKFVNCATDTDARINDSCVTITPETAFKNVAAGDYRPKTGSGLINAGCAVPAFSAKTTDFAGQPRVRGRVIDIGCYEGLPNGLALIIR